LTNDKHQKFVVITGVTQGLGRAMIDRFSEAGWKIAGCGRSERKIEEIRLQFGETHDFSVVDVSDYNAVTSWAKRIINHMGVPDLLINNASIINKNAPLWEISAEEFNHVMNVNVTGVFNMIKAFVPAMIKQKHGIIINISSSWGRIGEKMLAPYCSSKFAIEGLTQSLALELPEGLAVVALDPGGGINTDMLRSCAPEYLPEAPSPEEWARVAVPYMMNLSIEDNGKSLTCPKPKLT
jgi:NAD(P)-dependent dehydrogenase (short-subunit alcohol dehydrogenase family)